MATLSDLRDRVLRILSDPGGGQFEPDLIDDGLRASLDAILPWVFKRDVATLEADGATSSWELPEDLYRITAVFDADSGLYIENNSLSAGTAPGAEIQSNQDWLEYPEGEISLARAPDSDVTLFYGARWAEPEADADEIEAPSWCHRALVFYAASYALMEKASASANIRQWNVRVDSGSPVMNPMKDMSSYYLERFKIEVDRMPARVRGVHG